MALAAVLALSVSLHAHASPADSLCSINIVARDPGWTSIEGPEWLDPDVAFAGYSYQGESFAVDPSDQQHIFLGSRSEVFVTHDGGCSWQRVFSSGQLGIDLPQAAWQLTDLDIARFSPSEARVYMQLSTAGDDFYGATKSLILYSDDDGKTWLPVDASTQGGLAVGHGWMAVSPSDPTVLYVTRGTQATWTLFASTDSGETWDQRTLPGGFPEFFMPSDAANSSAPPLVVNPLDPSDLWAIASILNPAQGSTRMVHALMRSQDGGVTWRTVHTPIEEAQQPFIYSFDVWQEPNEEPRVAVNNFYTAFMSTNAGKDWFLIAPQGADGFMHVTFGKGGDNVFITSALNQVTRFSLARRMTTVIKSRMYNPPSDSALSDEIGWRRPSYVSGAGFYALTDCFDCNLLLRYTGRGT